MKKRYDRPVVETLDMELTYMLADSLTISDEETSTVDQRDVDQPDVFSGQPDNFFDLFNN